MKLLIISLNYAPEPTGFAPHTTALAEHLVSQRHDVTVLTGFPFAPECKPCKAWRGRFIAREAVHGVDVVRVTHFIPRRPGSALQRMLLEGSFVVTGLIALLSRLVRGRGFDLVLYVGAQPALAWLARAVASFQRVPYIVKITDLAAQAAVDVGIVSSRTAAAALQSIEFKPYLGAAAAIIPCDSFREALERRGYATDDVHLIRDSIDLDSIRPGADRGPFRQKLGMGDDEFLVLYSGSLGLKQALADAVRAAAILRDDCPNVRWVLVGEGEMRDRLQELIGEMRLTDRVRLLPLQPEADMNGMFATADVLLLSQLRTMKDTVIPSKLLMYMAAGRPILAAINSGSQAADILRDADGGLIVQPEDPAAIADGIRRLRQRRAELDGCARRSREYAERHFDRAAIVRAQQELIESVARRGARPGRRARLSSRPPSALTSPHT